MRAHYYECKKCGYSRKWSGCCRVCDAPMFRVRSVDEPVPRWVEFLVYALVGLLGCTAYLAWLDRVEIWQWLSP